MDADNVTNRIINFYREIRVLIGGEKHHDNKCIQVANHREIYFLYTSLGYCVHILSESPAASSSLLSSDCSYRGHNTYNTARESASTVRHYQVR